MAILEVTDECISALYEIFMEDKQSFIDLVKDELDSSFSTLYMN